MKIIEVYKDLKNKEDNYHKSQNDLEVVTLVCVFVGLMLVTFAFNFVISISQGAIPFATGIELKIFQTVESIVFIINSFLYFILISFVIYIPEVSLSKYLKNPSEDYKDVYRSIFFIVIVFLFFRIDPQFKDIVDLGIYRSVEIFLKSNVVMGLLFFSSFTNFFFYAKNYKNKKQDKKELKSSDELKNKILTDDLAILFILESDDKELKSLKEECILQIKKNSNPIEIFKQQFKNEIKEDSIKIENY